MRRSCAGPTGQPGCHEYGRSRDVTRCPSATYGGGAGAATMGAMSVAAILAAVACFSGTQGSNQLVTVQAPLRATTATLSLWTRKGACWRRAAGPWQARLGRNGLSAHKREGDGTTPAGTYRFGTTVY